MRDGTGNRSAGGREGAGQNSRPERGGAAGGGRLAAQRGLRAHAGRSGSVHGIPDAVAALPAEGWADGLRWHRDGGGWVEPAALYEWERTLHLVMRLSMVRNVYALAAEYSGDPELHVRVGLVDGALQESLLWFADMIAGNPLPMAGPALIRAVQSGEAAAARAITDVAKLIRDRK